MKEYGKVLTHPHGFILPYLSLKSPWKLSGFPGVAVSIPWLFSTGPDLSAATTLTAQWEQEAAAWKQEAETPSACTVA